MAIENMDAYVGHVTQKVNLAQKAGDITGAQSIAFHKRLATLATKGQTAVLNKAALLEQLSMVEDDLKRWEKPHDERTGTAEAGSSGSSPIAG